LVSTYDRLLGRRASYMLLTASPQRLADELPGRFTHVWAGLMLASLTWGVLLAWLWGTAWSVFRDYEGMPLMQVAVVVSATVLWLYRRSVLSLSQCLGGKDARTQNLITTLVLVVFALALLGLRTPRDAFHDINLPPAWQWTYPAVVQRVLILAPLWGAWAMLVTCQFCKPNDDTEPAVSAFARGCGPLVAAVCMAVPLAPTLLYFYFLNWWRVMLPAVTIFTAIAAGLIFCRRTGGLTRRALLAANFLTQLAFILSYLANR